MWTDTSSFRSAHYHGPPTHSDQGCQFTVEDFAKRLLDAGVAISRDGKDRCLHNVFVERL